MASTHEPRASPSSPAAWDLIAIQLSKYHHAIIPSQRRCSPAATESAHSVGTNTPRPSRERRLSGDPVMENGHRDQGNPLNRDMEMEEKNPDPVMDGHGNPLQTSSVHVDCLPHLCRCAPRAASPVYIRLAHQHTCMWIGAGSPIRRARWEIHHCPNQDNLCPGIRQSPVSRWDLQIPG